MSVFTPKIKQILGKVNEGLKRKGVSVGQMFGESDANKNGVVEKEEFVGIMTR